MRRRGVGWYRKTFSLDAADRGKRVYFDFDGVMAFPQVYVYTNGDSAELFLNGKSLGRREKGVSDAVPKNLALGRPVLASSQETEKAHLATRCSMARPC